MALEAELAKYSRVLPASAVDSDEVVGCAHQGDGQAGRERSMATEAESVVGSDEVVERMPPLLTRISSASTGLQCIAGPELQSTASVLLEYWPMVAIPLCVLVTWW